MESPLVNTKETDDGKKFIKNCIKRICHDGGTVVRDGSTSLFETPILTPEILLLAVKFCVPFEMRKDLEDDSILEIASNEFSSIEQEAKKKKEEEEINVKCIEEQKVLKTRIESEELGRRRCWKDGFHISIYEKIGVSINESLFESSKESNGLIQPVENQLDILRKEKARLYQIHTNPAKFFPRDKYEIRSNVKSLGKKCTLYRKIGGENSKVVQCMNCFHHCVLNPGPPENSDPEEVDPRSMIGICGARHNWKGELYLIDHSTMRPIAQCVDHVEKTPLFHFYPAERTYYIGTIGCNMRCSFCISWETSQSSKISLKRKKNGYIKDIEDLHLESMPPEKLVENAVKKNCGIIEYNVFNEATISFDTYFYETAKLAKEKGLLNVVCTNAYQSLKSIDLVAPYIDAVSIGLKSLRNDFYSSECGVRLSPILRNIKIWVELGIWVEIQSLIIPGETDSDEDIENIAKFVHSIDPGIVLHFSQFKKDYKYAEREDQPDVTPDETLLRALEIGQKVGLKYVYCDVRTHHAFTKCSNCGENVVSRGYVDGEWQGTVFGLTGDGKCKKCGELCHGIWGKEMKVPLVSTKLDSVPLKYYQNDVVIDDDNSSDVNVKILYASQTGVTEEFAKRFYEYGKKEYSNISSSLIDLVNYNESNLENESIVVICVSTYFFGRIPRSGDRFFKHVMGLKKEIKGLKYCVVGIGSTGNKKCHLETYQVVARELEKKLALLGAKRLTDINCEANKRFQFKDSLERIKKNVWASIKKIC